MRVEDIVEEIKKHKLFLHLKDVVENIDGWHDHEDVYAHSIKTAEIALSARDGSFITNEEAKALFQKFMNEEVGGMKKRDIVVLTGLLHDSGKILSYKDEGKIRTLITPKPGTVDQTMCPGHEYYGGEIVVKEILKGISVHGEVKEHISKIVKLHGVFNEMSYYTAKNNWSTDETILDVKSRAEGYYIEAMFNSYVDCNTARAFRPAIEAIEKIFDSPLLYLKREYFI